MTRLAERVRCIVCTHYTTEVAHVDGCSHIACPQRRQLTASSGDRYHAPYQEAERQVVRLHRRRVEGMFDSYYTRDEKQ